MKRRSFLGTVGIVTSFTLAGCSDTADSDASPTTTDDAEASPTTTPTANNKQTETDTPDETETPEGTPTEEGTPSPTATDEPQSMSDSGAFERLKEAVERTGFSLTYTRVGSDRGAYFEYVDGGTRSRKEREQDVRDLARGFLALVENGWNVKWLEAALMSMDETVIFTWEVKPEWVSAYLDGSMTEREVLDRTVETIS